MNGYIKFLVLNLICLTHSVGAELLRAPDLPSQGVRLYLASENRTLPNHAMVSASRFRVDDLDPMDGISDAIWCQAAPSLGVVHYQWYGPRGLDDPVNLTATLSNASNITNATTFVVVENDQVGLARPSGKGIGDNEGLYQCVITTNETKQTLVVGVYRTGTYINNAGPVVNPSVQFSLISSRDADPPQFTLSFNVSNAPATTVNCSVNDEPIENMSVSRDVLDGEPPTLTEVTVTIRQRSAGVYNCTVSNARVEDGTITDDGTSVTASPGFTTVTLDVTASPNVTGTSACFLVTWTAPATPVSGYEVFYVTAAGETHSAGNTTDTNLTVCDLSDVHSVFVVAYGGNSTSEHSLPSVRSNITVLKSTVKYCTETINPSTSATMSSSPGYIDFRSFLGLLTASILLLILLAMSVTMNFIVLVTKLRRVSKTFISGHRKTSKIENNFRILLKNTAEYDMKTKEYQEKTSGFSESPLELQKSSNTSTNESASKSYPYASIDMSKKTSIKNLPGAEETNDGTEIQGVYQPFQATLSNQEIMVVTPPPLEDARSFSTFNTKFTEVAKKPLTPIGEETSPPTLLYVQENACQSIEGTYNGLNPMTSTVTTFSHQNANPNSPTQPYACEDEAVAEARKAVSQTNSMYASADMKTLLTLPSTKEPPNIPSYSGTDENISPTLT